MVDLATREVSTRYAGIDTSGITVDAVPATADNDLASVARNYCGPYVGERSWIALVGFPQEISNSLQGQLFVARRSDGTWEVWMQYH